MKRVLKQILVTAGAIPWLALTASQAFAQCAMCRAAAVASGKEASLNLAILVLLVPPVVLFCAIFVVAYRLRAAQDEPPKLAPEGRHISSPRRESWVVESNSDQSPGRGDILA